MCNQTGSTCKQCGLVFAKNTKAQFCSRSCTASFSNKSRSKEVEISCIGCGIIRKYKIYKENSMRINKYCSKKCYANHQKNRLSKQLAENAWTSEQISAMQIERFKNKENHPWFGKKHSEESKNKISEKALKRFSIRENNPMFGKYHSRESKEKMSDTRTKKWVGGEYVNIWRQGEYFSMKMKMKMIYRSSWEREYLKYLDNNNKVANFYSEWARIPYFFHQKRWYVPDVLVEYVNGNREIQEVKPKNLLKTEINKLKFAAARRYCKENNLKFRVLTEEYLRYIGCNI